MDNYYNKSNNQNTLLGDIVMKPNHTMNTFTKTESLFQTDIYYYNFTIVSTIKPPIRTSIVLIYKMFKNHRFGSKTSLTTSSSYFSRWFVLFLYFNAFLLFFEFAFSADQSINLIFQWIIQMSCLYLQCGFYLSAYQLSI